MRMSFRWYGQSDPVSLEYIRQIPGMHDIVSAIYDEPVGEVWPMDKILALKSTIEAAGIAARRSSNRCRCTKTSSWANRRASA